MNSFLRNFKIIQRCISTHGTTRDALSEWLQSIRKTASLLYNRMMENWDRDGRD